MKIKCENCKHTSICRHFKNMNSMLSTLRTSGYLAYLIDETWKLWTSRLSDFCNSFEEKPVIESPRDKNGVLIGHKPLKIWYPNQNLDEVIEKSSLNDVVFLLGPNIKEKCLNKLEIWKAPR